MRWKLIAGAALLLLGILWAFKKRGERAPATGGVVLDPGDVTFIKEGDEPWSSDYQKAPKPGTDGEDVAASETLLQRLTRESAEAIRRHDEAEELGPEKL